MSPETAAASYLDVLVSEVLEKGQPARFKVRGRSMRPFLREGDTALVEPVAGAQLRVGHIVVWRRPWGGCTMHRLVRIDTSASGTVFITRGDNSALEDMPVPPAELIGRVVEVERDGRRLALDSRTGAAFNAFVSGAARWRPWRRSWLVRLGRMPWRWLQSLAWRKS